MEPEPMPPAVEHRHSSAMDNLDMLDMVEKLMTRPMMDRVKNWPEMVKEIPEPLVDSPSTSSEQQQLGRQSLDIGQILSEFRQRSMVSLKQTGGRIQLLGPLYLVTALPMESSLQVTPDQGRDTDNFRFPRN